MNILVLIGALIIGLSLGLLGSGGSILTVPVLVYLAGQEEKTAIASSLFIVGSIAAIGTLPYLKQKLINWEIVLQFGISGIIGTYAGSGLSALISGSIQLVIFASVILISSFLIIKSNNESKKVKKSACSITKIIVYGFLIGVLTGVVGVGGGFLIIPALVLLTGLSMLTAIASSLVIITLNAYSGFFIKYLLSAHGLSLDWGVICIMVLFGGVGSVLGNRMAHRVPQANLKKVFSLFLIVIAIYILYKTIPKLL